MITLKPYSTETETNKDAPRTERIKIFQITSNAIVYISIQMKQKELTKTFMMI